MTVQDAQVRKMMEEMSKHGQVGLAALRSGMDRKTARKYLQRGALPSGQKSLRAYRTRVDPFEGDWEWLAAQVEEHPGLEAKILFEALQRRRPNHYQDGQLRTLQRRLKRWRAEHGPDRRVFFSQLHRPGEALQLDFTRTGELAITIAGEAFEHLLCHVVLPYSNWQAVTVCLGESFLALKRGLQDAVFRIGRVPEFAQTDNSTAATHELASGGRGFNEDYREFVSHLGMTPRTTAVGEKEQNGDVESANGALKRRLRQELMLRGSSDFESIEAYEVWLQKVVQRLNVGRAERFAEDCAAMHQVRVARLAEFVEVAVQVTSWSTIRVNRSTYSVPSQFIGEKVRVRMFERQLEVYYADRLQLSIERVSGRDGHRINYRHIIWSLVQKPGAFARYRYREDLFPSLTFRRTFDAIHAEHSGVKGDLQYLRLLHLAAATTEAEVELALQLLVGDDKCPDVDMVKSLLGPVEVEVPQMAPLVADLEGFDTLLAEVTP